jgi:ribonuclease HI
MDCRGIEEMTKPWIIHTDGAARGNPGPAAYAFVITRPDGSVIEDKATMGTATNNVAEYTALIHALERAAKEGADHLTIHSDSELMVKQMRGEYRVKNPDLKDLYEAGRELVREFRGGVDFKHVPRSANDRADRLANQALDGDKLPASRAPRKKAAPPLAAERVDAARSDGLQCLRDAAAAWKRQDPRAPAAEQVWDQIWSVLEEHGIVR